MNESKKAYKKAIAVIQVNICRGLDYVRIKCKTTLFEYVLKTIIFISMEMFSS